MFYVNDSLLGLLFAFTPSSPFVGIGCQFGPSYLSWVGKQPSPAKEVLGCTEVNVPSFHLHMHIASCQARNGRAYKPGAGLGHGEPIEQVWSEIGAIGPRTMHMSKVGRTVELEHRVACHNEDRRAALRDILVKMITRAKKVKEDALAAFTRAMRQAEEVGIALDPAAQVRIVHVSK